ncbi:MAG: LPXTG cell wall anchor domain-containing protein [Lachnospiraceae bacterium]|nr:LPXTG cell wall anchor domain-containing protein [Lachnospiraceae bacterium]
MKKQFLRTGAVITAFSLAAGLPGIRTVRASEEEIKTYRYEGIDYFYTLNEEKEIVWTTDLKGGDVILIPPFVKEDSEPMKEEDLPIVEAEPTVTLIVTEITPEVLVFDENVPVPEVSEDISENETLPAAEAPDIDPTVIPTEEELESLVIPEAAPEETVPEELPMIEETVEETAVSEETAPEAEAAYAEAETDEVLPEAEKIENEEFAVTEEVPAKEAAPEDGTKAKEAPAAEVTEAPAQKAEIPAATVTEAPAEKAEIPAAAATEAPAEKAEIPAATATEAPAEKAEIPAAAVTEAPAEEASAETLEPTEEPMAEEEAAAPAEENPLLVLGRQQRMQKYDNLIAAPAPTEEISEAEEPAEEAPVTEEDILEETPDAEAVGTGEDALVLLAKEENGTEEETAVEDLPFAEETWTPEESVQAVIPEAVEATLEELETPADVTSVDESVAKAAPGTRQIVGDTDAPGSKTITAAPTKAPTAAPTKAPTATPAPATEAPAAPSESSGGGSQSSGGGSAESTSSQSAGKRVNPKTGDASTPFAYMAAMIASGMAFFTAKRKKRD